MICTANPSSGSCITKILAVCSLGIWYKYIIIYMYVYINMQALLEEVCYRTRTCPHMGKSIQKCDKSHTQVKPLTTCFYCITAYVWSIYVPIPMLLLNRQLSLIIKLKLCSEEVFWFWKLTILHKNQKRFLLSLVYNCLKGMFSYI